MANLMRKKKIIIIFNFNLIDYVIAFIYMYAAHIQFHYNFLNISLLHDSACVDF